MTDQQKPQPAPEGAHTPGPWFKVGDKVTCLNYLDGIDYIATVAKVGRRKLTLDNGAEWLSDGSRPWASPSSYSKPRLYHWTPKHDGDLARKRALNVLELARWKDLDTATLVACAEFVRAAKAVSK